MAVVRAVRDGPNPMSEAYERICLVIKEFEREVWFGGLQEWLQAEPTRGMSHRPSSWDRLRDIPAVGVLTFVTAGRAVITLQRGDAIITVIAAETGSDDRIGLQGIHATEEQAIGLLRDAIAQWKAGRKPVADKSVGII